MRSIVLTAALASIGLTAGCGAPPPASPGATTTAAPPLSRAPTPRSITIENPGGDAPDPEFAALELLDRGRMEPRRDRYGTLTLTLPVSRYWRAVKLWGHPTRAAFRFGDEHHGVVALWYEPAKGPDDPESCLRRFVDKGRPTAESFGVRGAEVRLLRTLSHDPRSSNARPMVIDVIDVTTDGVWDTKEYAAAIASYTSWPGTCLIQGFAVTGGDEGKHREIARRIRDRWVREAAPRVSWVPRITEAPGFDAR